MKKTEGLCNYVALCTGSDTSQTVLFIDRSGPELDFFFWLVIVLLVNAAT